MQLHFDPVGSLGCRWIRREGNGPGNQCVGLKERGMAILLAFKKARCSGPEPRQSRVRVGSWCRWHFMCGILRVSTPV